MALYNGMVLKRGKCMIEMTANELKLHSWQVEHTLSLLEEGNTVPFIARYRKEMTGGLDEEQIRKIEELKENTLRLEKRREDVLRLLKEQGVLDEGLNKAILACEKISQIDDLYRPYQQKKKTRAMLAKEAGLEPLAEWIRKFYRDADIQKEAQKYVKGAISSIDEAIQGAKDILAQWIAEDVEIRAKVKDNIVNFGRLETKKKKDAEDEKKVYQMYYEFSERVNRLAPHRIMAIDRGEKENIISVSFSYNKEYLSGWVARYLMRNRKSPLEALVQEAIEDGLKRLVYTAIEREVRRDLSAVAQEKSIQVFSMNLEHLLLQPPLKNKVILGFDPAYRTGCKLAVVDATGKVLDTTVIYPTAPTTPAKIAAAKETLKKLIEKYHITLFSVGNGTASRESEQVIVELLKEIPQKVQYVITNEAGASVYSASKLATEEFPNFDVGQRSAASIARRLQDPLAELVKIDPKSIGVGQYQHDMNQKKLGEALSGVVEDCVNKVGVDLNTASVSLLEYVSGISKAIAKNIVVYREENGEFKDRKELLKVAKLGPKAFEQCAGFLRIRGGKNPLDATSVHPESYPAAEKFLESMGMKPEDIFNGQQVYFVKDYAQQAEKLGVGEMTLRDIVKELTKPGRDPREEMPKPILRTDVLDMKDLKEGMVLKGTVRNVIDFGAFVDIGVHQDGLVHISQMTERYIKHPLEAVSVGDVVDVMVLGVDMKKKRISLTMKGIK